MQDTTQPAPREKTYYGVTLGILMVRSYFTRYPGDIGNATTWDFPVSYKIVHDATTSKMTDMHNSSLLDPFKRAAEELIEAGVDGITTTCGFLSIYQKELADFCGIPVATSSLLQVPMVEKLIASNKRVGLLTYNGEVLSGPYLEAVDVDPATPVKGMSQDSEFVRWIKTNDASVPFETLRAEVLATAKQLKADNPDLGAIVSECTNLAPFTADISDALGLPVFDCVTMVNWFHGGLKPKRFNPV
ncbi:MAG: aspartate/glutamate racemase family protein [Roseovarius sp.]